MKIGPDPTSRRDWIGRTILYALGVALLAASIHALLSTNKNPEVDDLQTGVVDQAVGNVSCYLLVDTTIRVVYHSFLEPHTHLFWFPL
jgi:hypothetical protein